MNLNSTRNIIGLILIIVGVSSLFGLGLFRYFLPLFIIWVGYTVMTGSKWPFKSSANTSSGEDINEFLLFAGSKKIIENAKTKGGQVTAIFSESTIDMSKIKSPASNITLDVTSVFASVKVRVPEGWSVTSDAVAILGGIDNKTRTASAKKTQLHITGVAVFGGIEIFD